MRMGGYFPDCRGTVLDKRIAGADLPEGLRERSRIMEQGTKIVEVRAQDFRYAPNTMRDSDGHGYPGPPCKAANELSTITAEEGGEGHVIGPPAQLTRIDDQMDQDGWVHLRDTPGLGQDIHFARAEANSG